VKQRVFLGRLLVALKRAGCGVCWLWKVPVLVYQIFKVMPFCLPLACYRFLHRPTASTFCDMLVHVSMMRCVKSLVSRTSTCLVRCTHIPASVAKFCSRLGFRVNRTVWRTQIWRDKIRCLLLKELDCFTSTEWRQNAAFLSQLFKSK